MMHRIIIVCFVISLSVSGRMCCAQSTSDTLYRRSSIRDSVNKVIHRFEKQVRQFEKQDSLTPPQAGGYLFVGSSSIRGWKTLKTDFKEHPVLGRGFGGSTFVELLHYAKRLVLAYAPSRIFVYCGENDMTLPYTLPGDVWYSFAQFDTLIQTHLPQTKIYYLSIKPCPKSWNYWPKIQTANQLIKKYIQQRETERLTYIDLTQTLLKSSGIVDSVQFLSDGIHIRSTVYSKWAEIIHPYMK
ncbi:MAG: hypothetical protein IAE67_08420 [Candidatus Competibacteraceae bacterium]|nr:hypothetical protein [Candidatus Competibacteraceae bacterium]